MSKAPKAAAGGDRLQLVGLALLGLLALGLPLLRQPAPRRMLVGLLGSPWLLWALGLLLALLVVALGVAGWLLGRRAIRYGRGPALLYGTRGRRPVLVAMDRRSRTAPHTLITGKSGVGKSKYAATNAVQTAEHGASIFMIDPAEELVMDTLCLNPAVLAAKGVVFIWPGADTSVVPRVFPWNLLHTGPGREPWRVAGALTDNFKAIWKLNDQNTIIIDTLKHTIWALAGAGYTLLEAPLFLQDAAFRAYIVGRAQIPEVTFWVANKYNMLSDSARMKQAETTLVRLARFYVNPHLKRMIGCGVSDPVYRAAYHAATGQAPAASHDLGDMVNDGWHVLCALPWNELQDDQFVVAALIQSTALQAIFRRKPNAATNPQTELFLDEVAAYESSAIWAILAYQRKYGANLTLSSQSIRQASERLQLEARTNCNTKIVFATDDTTDAHASAKMLFAFDPGAVKRTRAGKEQHLSLAEQTALHEEAILSLPKRHYLLKVTDGGPALTVRTPEYLPAEPGVLSENHQEKVRAAARAALTAGHRRIPPGLPPDQIDAELAWRTDWLRRQAFLPGGQVIPIPGPVQPVDVELPPDLLTFEDD